MSAAETRRVLFRCDGALVPAWLGEQPWFQQKIIRSKGNRPTLNLQLAELGGTVLARVGPRSADLVRIAAYAYRADALVPRTGGRDANGDRWRRHLALCIPVADVAYWADPEVHERLAATLRFLTDDEWEFAFCQAAPELWQLPLEIEEAEVLGEPTAVVLFSGGADSLCVLLEAVARGERPVAVGHWSTETHAWRQQDLLGEARQRFRGWGFPQIGFEIHGQGAEAPEETQRTRGFLFASIGAATAAEIGVGRVLYGDNGPVSINLPLNGQVVGARASRSTHPKFLERFNRLVADLFARPVVVSNPLQTQTRADVLGVLKRTRCEDLLPMTLSCSHWRGLPATTPHCGGCSQCVDRRFATIAAGLEAFDPAARYKRDVFLHDLPEWGARMMAESYLRVARQINKLAEEELLAEYGQIYDAVAEGDAHAEATVRTVLALVKRHARGVLGAFRTIADRHLTELVEGSLPETCLLRMAFAGPPVIASAGSVALHDRAVGEPRDPQGAVAPTGEENAFVFADDLWHLTYAGTTRRLNRRVGLTRIAHLLAEPFRKFTPEDLLDRERPPDGPPTNRAQAALEGLQREGHATGGFLFEEGSKGFVDAGVRDLLEQLDDARDVEDWELVAALDEEVKRIAEEWQKGHGLGDKPKPFADDFSRRPGSVWKSIDRAIDSVTDRHPALGAHLRQAIQHKAAIFSYQPPVETRWRVDLPKN